MRLETFALVFLLGFLGPSFISSQLTFITISDTPGFEDQDRCVQVCLSGVDIGGFPGYLGCQNNACLCRPDHMSIGLSFLSSCGVTKCSDSMDATAAASLLSVYCAAAIPTPPPPPTPTSAQEGSTAVPGSVGGMAPLTQTVYSSTTVTSIIDIEQIVSTFATTNAAGSAVTTTITTDLPVVTQIDTQSELGESDKIALGTGLGVGIPSFLFGLFVYVMARRRPTKQAYTQDTSTSASSFNTKA